MYQDRTLYTISDLHLGHNNIIRYCDRPFSCSNEMDQSLIERWNRAVTPSDTVIYVGDLSLSHTVHPREYLRRLNGIKVMIRGNHDRQLAGPVNGLHLHYGDERLFFTHYPSGDAIPEGFAGWIIHGHVHDNMPFFDRKTRRINVSCEVVDYRPVSLLWLYSLIKSETETLKTISEKIEDEPYRPTKENERLGGKCIQFPA